MRVGGDTESCSSTRSGWASPVKLLSISHLSSRERGRSGYECVCVLTEELKVGRVIAQAFSGTPGKFKFTNERRDIVKEFTCGTIKSNKVSNNDFENVYTEDYVPSSVLNKLSLI